MEIPATVKWGNQLTQSPQMTINPDKQNNQRSGNPLKANSHLRNVCLQNCHILQAKPVEICGVWLVAAPVFPSCPHPPISTWPTWGFYQDGAGCEDGQLLFPGRKEPHWLWSVGDAHAQWWGSDDPEAVNREANSSTSQGYEVEPRLSRPRLSAETGETLGSRPGMHSQPAWGYTHMGRRHKRGPRKRKNQG